MRTPAPVIRHFVATPAGRAEVSPLAAAEAACAGRPVIVEALRYGVPFDAEVRPERSLVPHLARMVVDTHDGYGPIQAEQARTWAAVLKAAGDLCEHAQRARDRARRKARDD
jgi:hypothetical protein